RRTPMNYAIWALAGLSLITACGSSDDFEGGGRTVIVTGGQGTLIVDWTIDGAKDPAQCQQGAATTIDITVDSSSGASHGYQADCGAFATSIDLPADSYTATAVLIDDAGNDRTTPIDVNPFRIRDGQDFTVPIDFPAGSFL